MVLLMCLHGQKALMAGRFCSSYIESPFPHWIPNILDGPALVILTITPDTVDEGEIFQVCGEVIFAGMIRNLTVYFPLIPEYQTKKGPFFPGKFQSHHRKLLL